MKLAFFFRLGRENVGILFFPCRLPLCGKPYKWIQVHDEKQSFEAKQKKAHKLKLASLKELCLPEDTAEMNSLR